MSLHNYSWTCSNRYYNTAQRWKQKTTMKTECVRILHWSLSSKLRGNKDNTCNLQCQWALYQKQASTWWRWTHCCGKRGWCSENASRGPGRRPGCWWRWWWTLVVSHRGRYWRNLGGKTRARKPRIITNENKKNKIK